MLADSGVTKLKIQSPLGRAGSIPAFGTTKIATSRVF